ncbi:unnamed protein product [Clonostachys rosea f. rosea IK726]|uniref:Uncharacterized protein n=1 Tax=Clonostachys rosea f. rosea IK726 TaxID=1349383 RepID=A0ACA9TWY7_BIOOC|nr:unnamed protein product [Clonostachys rosea f. rosea IK726]
MVSPVAGQFRVFARESKERDSVSYDYKLGRWIRGMECPLTVSCGSGEGESLAICGTFSRSSLCRMELWAALDTKDSGFGPGAGPDWVFWYLRLFCGLVTG